MKKKILNITLPELIFQKMDYSNSATPFDLRVFLYMGASAEGHRKVLKNIAAGMFGNPMEERIELVQAIHATISAWIAGGKSKRSIPNYYYTLRIFFRWLDENGTPITLHLADSAYRQWADHLHSLVLQKKMIPITAYSMAAIVSRVLSDALNKSQPLIISTRLLGSRGEKNQLADSKEDLADIRIFCELLTDIVDSLEIKAVFGKLPVRIKLRNGIQWDEWSGLKKPDVVKSLSPEFKGKKYLIDRANATRSAWENDYSARTRASIINLRLEAELLIFITQSTINLEQAYQLRLSQANYTSSIEGYQVREFKQRRGGEVLFEIYSAYRPHFEKFLIWRKAVCKEASDLLFPFIRKGNSFNPPGFYRIRDICKEVNVQYFGPRQLRSAAINWMFRQSRNPDLTAEKAQHTTKILLKRYIKPSFQVAKVEIIQFLKKSDPTLNQKQIGAAPAPGVCDRVPAPSLNMIPNTPKPDCIHPGGCLFCEHHRDIDSQDYIWSLASMKHLNGIIASGYRPVIKNKLNIGEHTEMILDVLVAKLKWFKASNSKREKWVIEALDRCNEGDFHPHWGYLIASVRI